MRCAQRLMKSSRRWTRMPAGPTSRSPVSHSGLRNLVDVMQDCRLLREAIADGRNPDQLPLVFRPDTLTVAVPHRDHGSALLARHGNGACGPGLLCVLDRHRLGRWRIRRAVRGSDWHRCLPAWTIRFRHSRNFGGVIPRRHCDKRNLHCLACCRGSRRLRC